MGSGIAVRTEELKWEKAWSPFIIDWKEKQRPNSVLAGLSWQTQSKGRSSAYCASSCWAAQMTEGSGCQGHRISQTMTGHVTVHQSWVRAGQSEYQSIATSYINNLKYTRSKGLHVDVLITLYGIISLYLNKSLPILNWANVCSPNILQTVRRTMIRFLIELLVRRTWFRQSKLYFILNWFVMRCKLRPELAADAQQTAWSKM